MTDQKVNNPPLQDLSSTDIGLVTDGAVGPPNTTESDAAAVMTEPFKTGRDDPYDEAGLNVLLEEPGKLDMF